MEDLGGLGQAFRNCGGDPLLRSDDRFFAGIRMWETHRQECLCHNEKAKMAAKIRSYKQARDWSIKSL
jgi:hypothetical protein